MTNTWKHWSAGIVVAVVFCCAVPTSRFASADALPRSSASSLKPVPRAKLCITEGKIEELANDRLQVTVTKMRAFVAESTSQSVEARFRYLGPTSESSKLASGGIRRQFGLKLRAQDGCNVVYAMWRFEPESRLVVSVKSNPGKRTHAECGAEGYKNIKPSHAKSVPEVRPGDAHTLRAVLDGQRMKVFADNENVWEGEIGKEALEFDGPVGMRSDNAKLEIEFFAGEPAAGRGAPVPACREGSREDD
jgi:hypothetical protein